MLPNQGKSHGTQPPPSSATGHPLPRRASPENSVTLRHHKLARDASLRASPGSGPALQSTNTSSPRRQSSDESQDTGHSDPKKWFDHSNENPAAAFDGTAMDVDPPFFQRESDSSNEEKPFHYQHLSVPPKLTAQSSSAEDYRSVIDDLTVEIQRLKEELRRYKQPGPDLLRKDKLFEIKVHGLPKRKKRELEAKLRDFAATLDDSQGTSSSQKKKNSRHRNGMYSGSGSMSKHASSSSGSNLRPADSAYASMSTGANSSGTSLTRPTSNARSNQKVENYLRDIPEGLYPRRIALTDKERKRLVVRRLEQLFTGKIGGRHVQARAPVPPTAIPVASTTTTDIQTPNITNLHQPPTLQTAGEPAREAQIVAPGRGASGQRRKKSSPDENTSNSRSNQTDSRETGNNSSSSGTNTSPPNPLPEQRPTRINDLDPDRVQIPSENMDYIRHLGLVPPELLEQQATPQHVHPDADGWVYLNLLCNLAQLHMMNVTSDFVRASVLEMSTKFQLSPDGQKIRWRGGTEGTNFSSDASGYSSQQSPSTDDTDGSNPGAPKRQKTDLSAGKSGSSRKNNSKNGQQVSSISDSFHYKPLFVHQSSSNAQMSPDDTTSSYGPIDDSNAADSRWDLSGSGTSMRRKRRRNGAIIYYSGAPFCTDLSGDPGDLSPTAQMVTNNEDTQRQRAQSPPRRTYSGSFIDYRPLTDKGHLISEDVDMDMDTSDSPSLITDNESGDSSDFELEFGESNDHQYLELQPLEPCGLGGVLPDDHFMVVVTTRRSKVDAPITKSIVVPDESTDAIVRRLATMSTSSPVLRATKVVPRSESPRIEIEYVSGRIKRLQPVRLPPPAIFFPPFSTDDSSTDDFGFESESVLEAESSEELRSRRANPHHSDGYPDGVDLSSGDEEGDEPDDSPNVDDSGFPVATRILPSRMRASPRRSSSAAAAAGTARRSSKSASADVTGRADASSAATAGGAESGYNSSDETS